MHETTQDEVPAIGTADLEPRRVPSQDRSRKRVDAILDGLAELMVERGFEAINTHHVAERANVPVGTLYQFFPNKYALVSALSRRYIERYGDILQEGLTFDVSDVKDEHILDQYSEAVANVMFQDKALAVLWAVMLATPELRPIQVAGLKMGHGLLMSLLNSRFGHLDEPTLEKIATTIYRASYAMLYSACQNPDEDKGAALEELKRLQNAYLKSYLKND
jgi:AcrR family transcriptional regulator